MIVVRGNFINFSATFLDADGQPTTPTSANLYVVYAIGNEQLLDTVAMDPTADTSIWTATWSTDGLEKAPISWSVRAQIQTAPDLFIVQDGNFGLSANSANQVGGPHV